MGVKYETGADYRIYQMSFFVGYPLAVLLFIGLSKIWPPTSLGVEVALPGYESDGAADSEGVLEGVPVETYTEKGARETEVKI